MSSARKAILTQLRSELKDHGQGQSGLLAIQVDPVSDSSPRALEERFVQEAEGVGIECIPAQSERQALDQLRDLLGKEKSIISWAAEHIPVQGFATWLKESGIQATQDPDPRCRVGITGADAALSTTGSLILLSGPGKPRSASLLPETHIAIVQRKNIYANLEAWVAEQREQSLTGITSVSNVVIVTGPSRTADIGMELVMGAHGPRNMHIILT